MGDKKSKPIPIKNIISEDGAHELATSENMQPYLRLLKAGLQDKDTTPHVKKSPNCRLRNATSGASRRP